jgi:iron(II)-dependent oxidoreductase
MVTANNQWRPQFQTFDGVEMAKVPPGCFLMGSPDGNGDEKPMSKICFEKPFWIDKTEVTQAQFKQFGGQAVRPPYFTGDNRPVEQITWSAARNFCVKRGARLPTEPEWEYAARGPDNLVYPWGNTFVAQKVIYYRSQEQGTANVGSIPDGASWIGAVDMSGNVWEWVSTIYKPYPYDAGDGRESNSDIGNAPVWRGGSYVEVDAANLRAAVRGWNGPAWSHAFGFRCARS